MYLISGSNVGGRQSDTSPFYTINSRRQPFMSKQLVVQSYVKQIKYASVGITFMIFSFVG